MAEPLNGHASEVGKPGRRNEQAAEPQLRDEHSMADPLAYPLDHQSGYFVAPRDVKSFEPLMRADNLCRLWLLCHARARHIAGWARAAKGNVYLERGQCVLGVREVAKILGISSTTSYAALLELDKLGLISRDAGQCGTVVTIRLYGVYGKGEQSSGTVAGTVAGTKAERSLVPNERENGRTEERKNNAALALATDAVGYLNEITGSKFRPNSKQTLADIALLARDKITAEQCQLVIDAKSREWTGTDLARNLRPSTLFRPTNFHRYLSDAEGAPSVLPGAKRGQPEDPYLRKERLGAPS